MAFTGTSIMISGLMELVTTTGTIRLCDGGILNWASVGQFTSVDPTYGTLGSVEASAEMVGDEAAGGQIVINVPSTAGAVALAAPQMQGKAIRFWLAEVDVQTGLLIGSPTKLFEGVIDTVGLSLDKNTRTVTAGYVDAAERLWAIREGNVLTSRFHQTAWPGEKGFDFCTGAAVQVPWGVSGGPRGGSVASSGGGVSSIFGIPRMQQSV